MGRDSGKDIVFGLVRLIGNHLDVIRDESAATGFSRYDEELGIGRGKDLAYRVVLGYIKKELGINDEELFRRAYGKED